MQSLYCVAQEGMGSCSRLLASTFPSPPEGGMECTQLFQVILFKKN